MSTSRRRPFDPDVAMIRQGTFVFVVYLDHYAMHYSLILWCDAIPFHLP